MPGIGDRNLHRPGADRARDANRLAWRIGHGIARVRQQVDEDLLQLDGIPQDHGLLRTQVDRHLDLAQVELLLHEGQRLLDHLPQGDRLAADGCRPSERAQMGDDLRGLADLLHGAVQLTDDAPMVRGAELDEVDGVADEQGGVVEGVVELVGDAGSELAEGGQFPRLDQLLLFLTQFLFAPLHLDRGLPQVPHNVNRGLAAGLEMQLVRARILQQVQQGPTGVVEPLSLVGQTSTVVFVVGQNVQHGLPLVGEALVDLAQVAHDVEHRTALGVAFAHAALQRVHVRAEAAFGRCPGPSPALRDRAPTVRSRGLRHGDQVLPARSRSPSLRKFSSSFSRAIIFSSRPTTTSSNFSRSKIFSCSSLLDFSRS